MSTHVQCVQVLGMGSESRTTHSQTVRVERSKTGSVRGIAMQKLKHHVVYRGCGSRVLLCIITFTRLSTCVGTGIVAADLPAKAMCSDQEYVCFFEKVGC